MRGLGISIIVSTIGFVISMQAAKLAGLPEVDYFPVAVMSIGNFLTGVAVLGLSIKRSRNKLKAQ